MPKISIVLPTFNGSRWLVESIQSIIDQTETDWELIIVNDFSNDNTFEIANSFTKQDKRISVISNKTNKKLPASLNIGFSKAKSDKYVTWTSDDNIYLPEALKIMSQYLDIHPDTDMVSMNMDFIDENTKEILYHLEPKGIYSKRNVFSLIRNPNIGAAFMYRRSIADKIGEYDINTFCAEDYDYWCRIALAGKIDYTTDIIYQYRINSKSLTATKKDIIDKKTKYIQHKYVESFFNKYNFGFFNRGLTYFAIRKHAPFKFLPLMITIAFYRQLKKAISFLQEKRKKK